MSTPTLLEMTQRILSKLDGDEINSISDTIEALQVAYVIRDCYEDIVDEHDLPSTGLLVNLEGQADTARPTHMHIPDGVSLIKWVKYDNRADVADPIAYADMKYLDPFDFVTLVNARDSTGDNTLVVMENADTPLVIRTDTGPTFWTSFDDEYIVFDAYNSDVDTTLQTSKNICQGYERPEFVIDDDTIPDLPENLIGYLMAKSIATCFADFKQEPNQKAEQRERRLRIRSQRNKWREDRMDHDDVDFGRKQRTNLMALARPENPNQTATGRIVGFAPIDNTSFYRIVYADGKGGRVPSYCEGMFTSEQQAQVAIKRFVEDTFHVAEENYKGKKSA